MAARRQEGATTPVAPCALEISRVGVSRSALGHQGELDAAGLVERGIEDLVVELL